MSSPVVVKILSNPLMWVLLFLPTSSTALRYNVALGKTASQSSTLSTGYASEAVDGNTTGYWEDGNGSVTHTNVTDDTWWKVELGQSFIIDQIKVHNRIDECCKSRLAGFVLTILRAGAVVWTYQDTNVDEPPDDISTLVFDPHIIGDEVKITPETGYPLHVAEVEVYGEDLYNVAFGNRATQSSLGYGDTGPASKAVDGNTTGYWTGAGAQNNSVTHTDWWKVELGRSFTVVEIKIYNRLDCCKSNLAGFVLTIFRAGTVVWTYEDTNTGNVPNISTLAVPSIIGDEVKITLGFGISLYVAEVEVYSIEKPSFYIQNTATNKVLRADSCTDGAEVKLASLDYNDDFQKFYFGADRTIVNSKCGGSFPAALSAHGCTNGNRIYVQARGYQDWEQQWALGVIDARSDGYFTANVEIGGSECEQVLSVAGANMTYGQPTTLWSTGTSRLERWISFP